MKAVPILRDWFDKLPALRFLVLCIKSLLSRYDLNNASSSGLSSYGVILLAINFLQINPMGRPMALLEQPMENEALGILLMDFLNYYGNKFRYADSVVSVTQGKLLSKEEKGWENPKFPGALCIECMLKPGMCAWRVGCCGSQALEMNAYEDVHSQKTTSAGRPARSGRSASYSLTQMWRSGRMPSRTR